jgi:archaemetzincin
VRRIQLMPFGSVPADLLGHLREGISHEFVAPCEILEPQPEPDFAFNHTRQQYSSTEILAFMMRRAIPEALRLLGVTAVDLYIPILTFVFGEAQLQGNCAVVSSFRLRQEFYGLPSDAGHFRDRLLKESVHELGHTFELSHCDDYLCVMSPSHGVEWIDLKTTHLCESCRAVALGHTAKKAAP